jgi:16S rRNA (guanine527-N7)-methyltransferase
VSATGDSPTTYGPLDFARDSQVSRETLSLVNTYVDLLREWNERLNLVSDASLADVWRRHIWDSAQLIPMIPRGTKTIVDLGSGAGFPGLVLAILLADRPGITVHLVESIQKKCRFLEAAIAATGAPAQVHNSRAEDLKGLKADVVVARAVAALNPLFRLAHPFFHPRTTGLFLKGRSLNDELTAATKSWHLTATPIPSRSDPSGFVLRVTGLTPWRKAQKRS